MGPGKFTQLQLQGILQLGATVAESLLNLVHGPASPIANDPVDDRISVAVSAAIQAAYFIALRNGATPQDVQRWLREAADQIDNGQGTDNARVAKGQVKGGQA